MTKTLLPVCDAGRSPCYGDGAPLAPHTCPYSEEVHDDHETLCTCCEACQRECADDI